MKNSQKRALYESIMKDVSKIIKKRLNEESYTIHRTVDNTGFGYAAAQDIVEEMRYTLRDFCRGTMFKAQNATIPSQQKLGMTAIDLTYRNQYVGEIIIDTLKERLLIRLEELKRTEDAKIRTLGQIDELYDRLEKVADQYGYRIVDID